MRVLALLVLFVGCQQAESASNPTSETVSESCTVTPANPVCTLRLTEAAVTALQLELSWDHGALESVEPAEPGVRVGLSKAPSTARLLLYRAGSPAPLAPNGTLARLRFDVTQPTQVRFISAVATDAAAQKFESPAELVRWK